MIPGYGLCTTIYIYALSKAKERKLGPQLKEYDIKSLFPDHSEHFQRSCFSMFRTPQSKKPNRRYMMF